MLAFTAGFMKAARNFDGTGPAGAGPMTGRGQGTCVPGADQVPPEFLKWFRAKQKAYKLGDPVQGLRPEKPAGRKPSSSKAAAYAPPAGSMPAGAGSLMQTGAATTASKPSPFSMLGKAISGVSNKMKAPGNTTTDVLDAASGYLQRPRTLTTV